MSTFIPSPQQQDYFNWITSGQGSAILEAVAGAGKTTTLIEGLKLMYGDIFFGAYNKKIADEISRKTQDLGLIGATLNVATMHSAGFAIWRRAARDVKVDENKCRTLWAKVSDPVRDVQLASPVLQLVSLAKQAGFGACRDATTGAWYDLIDHFSVECQDQEEDVIDLSRKLLAASVAADHEVIDFDDMIYAPLVHKVKPAKEYDWVLIDEAQDTNASRRALALLLLKRGGRLVAVGDPHQAIYGFTGADSNALDLISKAVNAIHIPLTVSYRCPRTVTELARTWVSHIQSTETAPEGTVGNLQTHDELFTVAKPGDAILCRFNAPIVGIAYKFIAEGIPAKIEGRDIGTNLKALARRWRVKSTPALLARLDSYCERETTKLRVREKESLAVAVEDRVHCLKVLIGRVEKLDPGCKDIVMGVCAEIDSLFGDNVGSNVVLLSTIHKSKGREWSKVFWLQTGKPGWVRKAWEQETELNLNYVAATRAMSELYLVPAPPKEG